MNPEDDEMEIDAALVLAKKIKLRTIHGIIIGTDLRVYECEDPYVLIFLFITELSDEFRLDIFKEDLSKELKYWLEGKYLRNPAVLVPTRIEESIMKFIKFAKTPKQEDLIMWILSRCEFYPSQSLGGGTNLRSPPSIVFGGKFLEDNNNHNENEQKLETIKQTILQNRYPKTSAIAAAKASKDDSHYILPSTHSLMFEGEDATDQHQSRSLQRSRSSGGRSLSTGRGIKTTTFDLKQHNKEIFQTNDDLGMFQLTKSLLGKSQTIQSMHKSQLKNRTGATSTINKQNFTNDHWRLYNEIQRTRQDIKSNLNDRRKLIEIAKTRQLQKTTKFHTIKKDIKNQKGANEFIENATNELSILKQIQTNIQDDLKQQKIKITRGTQRVIWTMAPNGYVNLRGKAQRGPVIGPGPLPPNATTDLKDPTLEMTCKKYYWDTAGRRHLRKHGIDYDTVEESLLEQAMNAIRKLSQNISSYKLNLKDVFERFDTSGDGFLSAQEMAEAFLAMGVKLDIPTMQAIFE